ncbi:MAG: glycosyltransferase 87 family protein [Terriglobales bacterium]
MVARKDHRFSGVRKTVLLALLLPALWFVAQVGGPNLRQSDFVRYWVAARLFLSGANPYSPSEVFRLEAQLHRGPRPLPLMFNPPTALSVIVPFGLLPFSIAVGLWFVLQFAIVFVSSFWLWRIYRGPERFRWLAIALPGIFLPAAVALLDCQMTPLLLLGFAAFLHFVDARAYVRGGAAVALLALKPQLCVPLGCVLLLWCLRERNWQLPAGFAAATAILLFPVWSHPVLVSQYREIIPKIWDDAAPAWGGILRAAFGYQHVWLQYLPVIPGVTWALLYWRKYLASWDWKQRLPMLLLVGFITAPYAWTYDEVILLPVFISAAVYVLAKPGRRLASRTFGFYILINLAMFILNAIGLRDVWFIWNAPVWLLAYIVLGQHATMAGSASNPVRAKAVGP